MRHAGSPENFRGGLLLHQRSKPKTKPIKTFSKTIALLAITLAGFNNIQAQDLLPSWNDGPTKQAIVDFVKATTETCGAKFVAPEERIAPVGLVGAHRVHHPN